MASRVSMLLTCFFFWQCGTSPQFDTRHAERASLTPVVTRWAQDSEAFATALYQSLAATRGNLVFSSYTTAVAMAMLYIGAQGETAEQMAETMHWHRDAPIRALEMRGWQEVDVHQANAAWTQQSAGLNPGYGTMLAMTFGAAVQGGDLAGQPELMRREVNSWAMENTRQAIGDVLAPGAFGLSSRALVAASLHVRTGWRTDNGVRVQPGPEGLTWTGPMLYGEGDGYQAVELPCAGDSLGLLVLVPSRTMPELEAALAADWLAGVLASMRVTQVQVSLPSFTFSSHHALAPRLWTLGIRTAFTPGRADLRGIDPSGSLYLRDVSQATRVSVDADGLRADSVVAAGGNETAASAAPQIASSRVPFIFMLRDVLNDLPLMWGRVEAS